MNSEQRAMCFAEWKKCWVAIVRASGGQTTADERAVRMGLTAKALGTPKSWSAPWNNREVDRLLAVMWAIAQPGNLDLQLRQIEQPLRRAEGSVLAQSLLAAIGIEPHGREAYLDGICRRIHKCALCEIDDTQWPDVLAALNHTRMHREGESHSHPRSPWQRRRSSSRGPVVSPRPVDPAPARPVPAPAAEEQDDGDPF